MANENNRLDNLAPYELCNIPYTRANNNVVTSRASYLGAFNLKDFSDLKPSISVPAAGDSSFSSYLGKWLLTYSTRKAPSDSDNGKEFFEILFTHFEKGISLPDGSDTLILNPEYTDVKTIYDEPGQVRFQAVTRIASKIGLIDLGLGNLPPVRQSRTGTEIREINRDAGLTKLVQCRPN